ISRSALKALIRTFWKMELHSAMEPGGNNNSLATREDAIGIPRASIFTCEITSSITSLALYRFLVWTLLVVRREEKRLFVAFARCNHSDKSVLSVSIFFCVT